MQAITVRDRDAGIGGLCLTDMPYPQAAENDVIVQVHAAGNMTLDDLVVPDTAASAAALEVAGAGASFRGRAWNPAAAYAGVRGWP
jgi:hypothetical protein